MTETFSSHLTHPLARAAGSRTRIDSLAENVIPIEHSHWLRELELNQRSLAYEASEMTTSLPRINWYAQVESNHRLTLIKRVP